MSRLRVLVLVLSGFTVLGGCNSPAVPPPLNYATVYGTVSDGTSGKPLPGATVTVGVVLSATTGSDGTFTVVDVPAGPFTAVISAPGFQSQQSTGTVASGDRFALNVSLYK